MRFESKHPDGAGCPVRDGELMGDAGEGGNEKPSNPMCKR